MANNNDSLLSSISPTYRLIWDAIEEAVLVSLQRDIQQLVKKTEDAFFNTSLNAKTSKEKNQAYQAIKALKQHSPPIHEGFGELIKQQIADLGHNNPSHPCAQTNQKHLNRQALEQSVALSAITSRLLAETVTERERLYNYLCSIFPNTTDENFWEENCPFSPSAVCHTFGEIVLSLQMDANCQLTFLKLFEQSIIKSLSGIYTELNQFLADNGINPIEHNDDSTSKIEDKNYRLILKKQLNTLQILGIHSFEVPFAHTIEDQNPPLATQELVKILQRETFLQSTPPLSASPIKEAIKNITKQENKKSLTTSDTETAHLLTLFFNTLLSNNALSAEIRLQISRLQLPISVLVFQQQDFFENHSHPARLLVNLLGAIGKVCPAVSGDNRCMLLLHITDTVSDLCEKKPLRANDFVNAYSSIEVFSENLKEKANRLSSRFATSLQNQVSQKKAQHFVDTFLYQSLQNQYLPEIIMDFLINEWRSVLIRLYMRTHTGNAWETAKNTTKRLLYIASQEYLNSETSASIKGLCQQIDQCITIASATGEPIVYSIEKINQSLSQLSTKDTATQNKNSRVTMREKDLIILHHTTDEQNLRWKQSKQEERLDLRYQATSESNRLKSGKLTIGDSIQFLDRFSNKILRGTIAAHLKESNQFLFVDVNGFRLFEKTYQEITYELERNRALIHQQHLTFEDSVNQIQHQLLSLQNETTSLH